MTKIGLLSDTHGFFDQGLKNFFSGCSEIWHAGDIGSMDVINEINAFKPLRAVYGNIDGPEVRNFCPEFQRFTCEGVKVIMIHIGGYPGKYVSKIRSLISTDKPDLLVTGHSHILRIMNDKKAGFLFINPGAAGNQGFHTIRTALRFTIHDMDIRELEIIELPKG